MSEKEKMQTEELAKIMDDAKPLGKSALSFMAGYGERKPTVAAEQDLS